MEERRPPTRTTWAVGILLVVVLAALILPGLLTSQRASNERGAEASTKVLFSVEDDFRRNDRDRNGAQDYWTADVVGLYDLVPAGAMDPLRLITRTTAQADGSRPNGRPWAGYWHAMMDVDETGAPYRQGPARDRNPSRFGVCTYPADVEAGHWAYHINQRGVLYRVLFKGLWQRAWPDEGTLYREWSRLSG